MNDIENIKNPEFLKNLSNEELEELASDIRMFILENVSKTGGHLSSNLGIVDLTIAMLKVFDVNNDKFIFDVGHQCYTYKILTGRAGNFNSLRKYKGLDGFQKRSESVYDHYEAGHSSTSLSAGLGFAIARDMDKKNYNVISIIGDGAISNGLSYEALNHIGDTKTKFIIILNDNEMSISKNVGALHNLLDNIRGGKSYNKTKENTKNFLNKTKIGKKISDNIHNIKSNIKLLYVKKGSIFNDLGIEYYGPINGHDYKELIKYLEIVKSCEKPVILHVITQKGKGYIPAETDEEGKFHGIGPFNIDDGSLKNKNNLPSYSEVISSFVYNYAKKDKNIICLTPAMGKGSALDIVKQKLPNQYIDVGINEEHCIVLANSLALNGKKPIVFMYSTFMQRGYDEILHDVARMNSPVIFCVDRCGFVGGDGQTHQGLFDIPFLLSIPNIIISSPKDAAEANCLLNTALTINKPFFIRYPKINLKYSFNKPQKLVIGSWEQTDEGTDGIIISYGDFVSRAQKVREKLLEDNISLAICNARFIKPIDKKLLDKILLSYRKIFIYEESMKIGSLASYIVEYASSKKLNNEFYIYAVSDKFMFTASREELIKFNELDEISIYKKIKNVYK